MAARKPVADRVRSFIFEELRADCPADFADDDPLLDGVLDSLGVFQVAGFLEDELGVAIEDEELVPSNFATIRSIADLVESKLNGTARIIRAAPLSKGDYSGP